MNVETDDFFKQESNQIYSKSKIENNKLIDEEAIDHHVCTQYVFKMIKDYR